MTDLNRSMFRANDIRTPAARLTEGYARRLARAEAVYFLDNLGVTGVVVAHDARASGPYMLEVAVEEYIRAGLDVIVLPGVSGSCLLYYAAMRHPDLAAVMFGASHNPSGDTGRKIVGPGVRPIAQGIGAAGGLTRIEQLYIEGVRREAPVRGRIMAFDPIPGYVAYSLKEAGVEPGSLRRLHILHDYVYGAGGRELMLGFAPTEARLTPLHYAADGQFRLGDPNPVKQEVIAQAIEALRTGEYDLGMLYDGDADRLDLYLGDRGLLASSFAFAAFLPLLLRQVRQRPATVLVDAKSNPLAILEMVRSGVSVDLTPSGHSRIKETMYQRSEILGVVEESAHYYRPFMLDGMRFCTENTLYFSLLAARCLRETPERFTRMAQLQASTAREREWGHVFPNDSLREEALEAVVRFYRDQGAQIIQTASDGLPLGGDLLRFGIPEHPSAETAIPDTWLQISQRASQSEDHLARWEASGSDKAIVADAKATVQRIIRTHQAGPEYQG